jgi:uncharacterized membrane protein YphA (DoxX/SURF4 family)
MAGRVGTNYADAGRAEKIVAAAAPADPKAHIKEKYMNRNGLLYGIGAIGLGAVGIAFGDFAMQWQPVASDVPMRTGLAYLTAASLALAGCLAIFRRTEWWGTILLAAIYTIWTLLLHGPRVAANPLSTLPWQAFCEIAAMAAGGFALFATISRAKGRERIVLFARVSFGGCAIVFGANHFIYSSFTASFVPGWIPFPLFWAYATGMGHAAAGLALVSGLHARLAATMLSLMMGSFAVLLHLPRVLVSPGSHIEWTMLMIATTLSGAAWGLSRALTEVSPR